MAGKRLAVVGSRTFRDWEELVRTIGPQWKAGYISEIISGKAKGADSLAARFAKNNNIPLREFEPDYDSFGKSAPFIRNQQIVDNAECMVAFWDGSSAGTLDSIKKAIKAKLVVLVVPDLGHESGPYDEYGEMKNEASV
jgi:hypothetical protein